MYTDNCDVYCCYLLNLFYQRVNGSIKTSIARFLLRTSLVCRELWLIRMPKRKAAQRLIRTNHLKDPQGSPLDLPSSRYFSVVNPFLGHVVQPYSKGPPHYSEEIWIWSVIFAVRPTLRTNPSRKLSFSKTLFKLEGFENAGFVFLHSACEAWVTETNWARRPGRKPSTN